MNTLRNFAKSVLLILTNLNNDPRIIKMNKLAKITDMIFNLIIPITSKMGDPATPYLRIIMP